MSPLTSFANDQGGPRGETNMSDFCFSPPIFNRIFRQAKLMDRMMDQLGVTATVAMQINNGRAWYEARTKCIDCLDHKACRRWLDNLDAQAAPPEFCANARFFSAVPQPTKSRPHNRRALDKGATMVSL
jgi:hypothetical protein